MKFTKQIHTPLGVFPTLKAASKAHTLEYSKVKTSIGRLGYTYDQVFGVEPYPPCPNCGATPALGRQFCNKVCAGAYDRKQRIPTSIESKQYISDPKYKIWYDRFIAAWRADSDEWLKTNKECREYREAHHIIPKCMGGTDNPNNLIYLVPEKHLFVHILLAKGYATHDLWTAVRLMLEFERYTKRARLLYGVIRRNAIEILSGDNHPRRDKKVYNWIDKYGNREHCTRSELIKKYNLGNINLSGIISKKIYCSKGWTLESRINEPGFSFHLKSGNEHSGSDKIIRLWRHKDGREFEGTNLELLQYDTNISHHPSHVVKRKLKSINGWYLVEQYTTYPKRESSNTVSYNIITLKHHNGEQITGKRIDLQKSLNMSQGQMSQLLSGKKKNANGWMLPNTDPDKTQFFNRWSKVTITVEHPVHGRFTGNSFEFRDRYYSNDIKAQSRFAELAKKKRKRYKEWIVISVD